MKASGICQSGGSVRSAMQRLDVSIHPQTRADVPDMAFLIYHKLALAFRDDDLSLVRLRVICSPQGRMRLP